MEKNPFIEPENYFQGYADSIEELKNNPELISLDKLCYELFEINEMGRKFIELITARYLIPPLANLQSANYHQAIIWADGFKEAFRMIIGAAKAHSQRIKAETDKNVR